MAVVHRSGILTFVLADIEGSTRLAQRVEEGEFSYLIGRDRRVRAAIDGRR